MGLDLTKLSAAPWRFERRYSNECETVPRIHCPRDATRECGWVADLVGAPYLGYESTLVNAEFIALARNAFDVMMRRGWGVGFAANDGPMHGWFVKLPAEMYPMSSKLFPLADLRRSDPFTALVEADKWYTANVEAR